MNLFDVYPLLDLEPVAAKGSYIYCNDGKEYLDFYGGHAVISIGHTHPHYVSKIGQQLNKLGFYSNSVQNPLQTELAKKLGIISGYEDYQLFLCNSGAEAIENALKVASFYTQKSKVIAFNKAFHGRTTTALSVTDNDKYTAPINEGREVVFLAMNDIESFKKEIVQNDVCAVLLEGIQGIGGIRMFDDAFLQEVEALCNAHDVLLICDEIQSGYGRTGQFFAHQHAGISPDIITVAKGMGNGFPVAGTLLSPEFNAFYGQLGSTFGGNHLACAASIAVLEVIQNEQLIENAANMGSILLDSFSKIPQVKEVRGKGLMIGLEFPFPIKQLRINLIGEQVVTGVSSNPNVLRLLPPLNITESEASSFITTLQNVLNQQTYQ